MPLFELVLQETYSQIREILLVDRPFTGPSLKNLGHWLGLQTLARDKGVSEEWLPLKEVILSAAHGDLSDLLCVLSFVSQLLGHSAHSRIFQPSSSSMDCGRLGSTVLMGIFQICCVYSPLYPSCWVIVPIAGSFSHLAHPWIVGVLGQLYASFSSNLHLCLVIEIIFTHLSIDISDFYSHI